MFSSRLSPGIHNQLYGITSLIFSHSTISPILSASLGGSPFQFLQKALFTLLTSCDCTHLQGQVIGTQRGKKKVGDVTCLTHLKPLLLELERKLSLPQTLTTLTYTAPSCTARRFLFLLKPELEGFSWNTVYIDAHLQVLPSLGSKTEVGKR